jgi:hypothetical protein
MSFGQIKQRMLPVLRASLGAVMLTVLCACAIKDQHIATAPAASALKPALPDPSTDPLNPQSIPVTLTEWKIEMPTSLPAGPTSFKIKNDGKDSHNLKIKGEGIEKSLSKNLKPGESGELQVNLRPGTYKVYCPVGVGPTSHDSKGMAFQLVVTELK